MLHIPSILRGLFTCEPRRKKTEVSPRTTRTAGRASLLIAAALSFSACSAATPTETKEVPATGTVTVLFSQVAMTGPTPPALMRAFWTCAAG